MITNVDACLEIAEEALAEAERLDQIARTPKPNGEPGFIIQYDRERKSFKNSLIAIAFAGIYFEALLYIAGTKRYGKTTYERKYDRKTYEEKLQLLGIVDTRLLEQAAVFRKRRSELVHEKAVEISEVTAAAMHTAQDEAKRAIALVREITREFSR